MRKQPKDTPGLRTIRNSGDAYAAVKDLERERRKVYVVLLLDRQSHILGRKVVAEGTRIAIRRHTAEVFRHAERAGATAVILAHNERQDRDGVGQRDLAFTRRCIAEGKRRGIPLLDHLVVGHQCCVSLRDSWNCYDLPWQQGQPYAVTDFLLDGEDEGKPTEASAAPAVPLNPKRKAAYRMLDLSTWERGCIQVPRRPQRRKSRRKGGGRP